MQTNRSTNRPSSQGWLQSATHLPTQARIPQQTQAQTHIDTFLYNYFFIRSTAFLPFQMNRRPTFCRFFGRLFPPLAKVFSASGVLSFLSEKHRKYFRPANQQFPVRRFFVPPSQCINQLFVFPPFFSPSCLNWLISFLMILMILIKQNPIISNSIGLSFRISN